MNDLLIYGKEYHCWREGEYLGIGIYTDDPNIGDSFLKQDEHDADRVHVLFNTDKWKLATEDLIIH